MSAAMSGIAISVIIPCRNAATVITDQLEALARQRCERPWEVIVVDNGSTDDTKAVVQRYHNRLPRLRVVEALEKVGAAYARNVGVAAASGENVAFCDADDEVAPGWLEAVDISLRTHEVIAFRNDTTKLNSSDARLGRELKQSDGLQIYSYPPYLPYSGSTIALRRALHQKIGGFDESMLACEDADFCWRLQLTGAQLHFVPDAVIHIRLRRSLRGLCRQARTWGEYNVLLYKKYRPLGMPKLARLPGLRNLVSILGRSPQVLHPGRRAAWLWRASWAIGRLIGSIKYRVWAL